MFWIHITSYGAYNALIGYLMVHRETPGPLGLALFTAAMAAHFMVNDYGLRDAHRRRYTRVGRWILSAAVIVGWCVGLVVDIHRTAIAVWFALLAGGILLNVLKEELPEE